MCLAILITMYICIQLCKNKGTVVNYLINNILCKLGLDSFEVLSISFGDDVIDEDAFEVRFYHKIVVEIKFSYSLSISQI